MCSTTTDEDAYYKAVLEAVKEASALIKEAFTKPTQTFDTKSTSIDLVTETDQAVESLLVQRLSAQFPTHRFIGEESRKSSHELTAAPTWIIDPIDGTTNFVHRVPFICISIALWCENEPRIAIVYNPILEELYSACKGKGAFLNGFPIHVAPTKELGKALIAKTFGTGCAPEHMDVYLSNVKKLIETRVRGYRSLGSAALNMCYVAAGRFDAYIEYGLHCWDMAAAALIIEEAGGCVIDPPGGKFDVMARRVLCTGTKELASQISHLLTHVQSKRDDVE